MRKQLQERPAERTACHDTETHCIAVKAAPATAHADQRAHQYRCDTAANEHRGGNDAVGGRCGRRLCIALATRPLSTCLYRDSPAGETSSSSDSDRVKDIFSLRSSIQFNARQVQTGVKISIIGTNFPGHVCRHGIASPDKPYGVAQ